MFRTEFADLDLFKLRVLEEMAKTQQVSCVCCESAKESTSCPSKILDAQVECSQPLIGFGVGLDCQHGNPCGGVGLSDCERFGLLWEVKQWQNYVSLQLKFQNYKQCIDTSSASNAIFEINKLRQQLQGKDDTIRNLDAQINIMKGVECTVPRDSGILSVLTTGTFRHPITVKVCVTDSWGDHYHLSVINVEGLKHTLFSVGTVCDGGFRSAFRQDFMSHPNYDMVDLLIGSRSMVMASVRLNHLNFGNIKRIWLGKSSKRITYAGNMTKDICVILSASLLIDCLNATVRFVRTDNGTEFVNKTLDGWFESVAVATACYTLNRSLVHTLHEKTYYELLKGKKPNLQYFRVFGSLCYPTNDYDDVGSPSTTVISEGAPAVTESLLPHQVPLPDTSDSDIETMFDHVDRKSFAPVARFEAIDLFHCPRSEHDMVFPVWSENASLTAELNEVVYVVQPEDCRSRASIEVVTDQERSLWDSKSSRAWFMTSYQAILIQIRIYKRQWSILLLYEKNRQTSFLLDVDTQRSTSGSLQFLGHRLVSWVIQKEKLFNTRAPSTLISVTTSSKSRHYQRGALRHILPLIGVKTNVTEDSEGNFRIRVLSSSIQVKKDQHWMIYADKIDTEPTFTKFRQIAVSIPVWVFLKGVGADYFANNDLENNFTISDVGADEQMNRTLPWLSFTTKLNSVLKRVTTSKSEVNGG
ncbi:retrovirus-related pol polyprotein from transposon TNT 1-94 [Tanacetum coccineum]